MVKPSDLVLNPGPSSNPQGSLTRTWRSDEGNLDGSGFQEVLFVTPRCAQQRGPSRDEESHQKSVILLTKTSKLV